MLGLHQAIQIHLNPQVGHWSLECLISEQTMYQGLIMHNLTSLPAQASQIQWLHTCCKLMLNWSSQLKNLGRIIHLSWGSLMPCNTPCSTGSDSYSILFVSGECLLAASIISPIDHMQCVYYACILVV
jgi:hypothetical protein